MRQVLSHLHAGLKAHLVQQIGVNSCYAHFGRVRQLLCGQSCLHTFTEADLLHLWRARELPKHHLGV